MGRKRTTSCWETHYSGEPCKRCTRLRVRRHRLRTCAPVLVDEAQIEHHRRRQSAKAYVHNYLKRGTIVPPDACEHCGATTISAWHPNLAEPRDILWLCKSCRAVARISIEPVELRWQWPQGTRAEPLVVTPVLWEKRPRRDRLPLIRQECVVSTFSDAEYEERIAAALNKLDLAILAADVLLVGT